MAMNLLEVEVKKPGQSCASFFELLKARRVSRF